MIRHFVISQVRRAAVHWTACGVALTALAGAAAAQVTPIAQIQANPASFVSQSVTVEGVVTVPVNYRGPMSYSGYIQDASGRGINLFGGSTAPPNVTALNTIGTKVQVTGEVAIFSTTTVELVNIATVTTVSSGNVVPPIELSTLAANDARWEGTLIQVAGTVSAATPTGSTATNYTMSDGSGSILARVYTALGIPTVANGTAVIGRGAGTNFNGTFQYYVGQSADFAAGTLPPDTAAPLLVGAWAPSRTTVEVTFNEPMETATAGNAASYEIFETGVPANAVTVSSVILNGPVATLTLGGNMAVQTDYTVRVTGVRDSDGNQIAAPLTGPFRVGGAVDNAPPTLSSAAASTTTSVTATFSEAIDPVTGGTAGNYTVAETANPGTTIAVQSATVAGSTATLTLATALTGGTNYTLRVTGVNDQAGNTIVGTATAAFTAPGGGSTTPIADIHANLGTLTGQVVTVEGVVYMPANYRGTLISGYIQDESGRGVNLFGNSTPNATLLNTVGNRVRVTGTVAVFGTTTVELTPITAVTLVSSGNTISPQRVSTQAANNANFEGTFIEIAGTVSSSAPTGTTAINYTVNDGSGSIDVRVVNTLNVAQIANGTLIVARGAGSNFQGTYQILVGRASDVGPDTGGPDTTPPSLLSANASNATTVNANFSEAVGASAGVAGNYSVFETATPGNTVAVSSVAVTGSTATLTLGASLTNGTGYTVRASGISDLAGNAMPAPQTATFTFGSGSGATPIANIHANLGTLTGTVVTVEGVVYMPANYRGTLISGYIQDESGRGVNVFGNSTPNATLLNTVGNRVRVTGTVAVFGTTTVELTPITAVTLVSSGNTISPQRVSTQAANNANFEGTFIEIIGTVSSSAPTGTTAVNYTVNDGSGSIDVRVVNTLNVAQIANGTRIFARGAGSNFQGTFQILVGRASDIGPDTGGSDTTPPTLASASSTGGTAVQVNFSENVDTVTGGTAGNFTVFETATPGNTIAVSAASPSGSRVTLTLASALTNGTQYTVRAQNVKDTAGNTMTAPQTANFTPGTASGVTSIAAIQANPSQFDGQTVTVQGQVYIPSNYRGSTTSGYIQDDSGRGINLFGTGANVAAAQNVGNIIRVTGQVAIFGGTTIEITNITALTVVSSGNPPLCPVPLSTSDAATAAWEGTFIEVRGTINGVSVTGTGATAAHNYVVDDGSGGITVRVVDLLSAPVFTPGQVISAKGAGSNFNGTFQILVGQTAAVSTTAFPDACGPSIVRVSSSGGTELVLQFSENVQPAEANTASNYDVFRTNAPGTTIAVTSAVLQGDQQTVRLTLASALSVNLGYTVRVRNVRDLQGNAVSGGGVTRVVEEALAETVSLNGPPFTFLPRSGESYPVTFTVPSRAANGAAEVVVRIFDLQGHLKKTLFDSRFVSNPFTNNRATRNWDGRDDVAQIVPAGTYIVHLLVTGERSGERQEAQMPVVVATRLDR